MKFHDCIGLVLKNKPENRILSIAPEETVYAALALMAKYDIGALLVLNGGRRLVGILSERDYARKVSLMGHTTRETQVREIMTAPVTSVSPQNTVDECLTLMTQHHFRHLPVVERGEVVGLVSIGDLVKWVISGQEHAIQELQGYITGTYPA
ncbi:MAG TPA: CBS domain-containing protein [Terracidiphilus sp.]|nr:CBS domain-containing protein [Terracidiphilus sp.]